MDKVKRKLIHLDHCRNVGWKAIYKLLKTDANLTNLYNYNETDLQKILRRPHKKISQILSDLHDEQIIHKINNIKKEQIKVIAIFDNKYPKLLREIYEPPWLLYVKGNDNLLNNSKLLAVVGSRNITPYGKFAIRKTFPKLINNDITVVSGLAKGVDTLAHKMAIELGGKTIAVIAGGLKNIYPRQNIYLAEQIMTNHLLVSEYPPFVKPQRWQFPLRNRIISGISFGTFVIEAGQRSGSFITADYALNEGREVFALPGNINNLYSVGTNSLIQKGAKLVMSADDIIDSLPPYLKNK